MHSDSEDVRQRLQEREPAVEPRAQIFTLIHVQYRQLLSENVHQLRGHVGRNTGEDSSMQ